MNRDGYRTVVLALLANAAVSDSGVRLMIQIFWTGRI